jgi:AcrR family transcriptional regulator
MVRWEPNARGRLEQAAMELFAERGYEQTTVADIAERAGLTERTFFRHYADKREVLFGGSGLLQELMIKALAGTPESAAPITAVANAVVAAGDLLEQRRPFSRKRNAVIAANRELQERELIKMATLSAALADELRSRGVDEPSARLTAEAGLAVFRVAFAQWVSGADRRDLPTIMRAAFAALPRVVSSDASGDL